eukprot:jgi/Galph1/2156/GphlegSOOS_G867.1
MKQKIPNIRKKVTRQFTEHPNWMLNSGTYHENDNGDIYRQSLSSTPAYGSTNEWLTIPSRCQPVVCSTIGLQSFLGPEACSQLGQVFISENTIQIDSKLILLSSVLTRWLRGMLRDEPTQSWRVGVEMEKERERNFGQRYAGNALQVADTKGVQSAGASSLMDSSFDWKSFLLNEGGLDEIRVNEYISKFPPLPISLLSRLDAC